MKLREVLPRLGRGAAAGTVAAMASGLVEGVWVHRGSGAPLGRWALASAEWGLLAPLGLGLGVAGAALSLLLSPDEAPSPRAAVARLRTASIGRPAEISSLAPLCVLGLFAWTTASAYAAREILASPADARTVGASLALAAAGIAVGLGAVVLALALPLRRALATGSERVPALVDPAVTTGFAAALAAALAWVGAATGSASGEGGFLGIWGILRRPELDLRAPAVLLVCLAAGVLGPALLRSVGGLVATAAGVLPLALTAHAALLLEREPKIAQAIERSGTASRATLALFRRATDRDGDGVSGLFGGGDCDDHDPRISPLAEEILDNGVDEDCSGGDLTRAAVEAASPPPPPPVQDDRRAALPRDTCFVLITIDTLRADLGFLGYERPVSPRLDALAQRSVVFEKAYSLASYTGKSVGPMLIGKYGSETHRNWGHFNKFDASDRFLAERLKAAGFRTASVHAHRYFGPFGGLDRGFDEVDLSAAPPEGAPWDTEHGASGAAVSDAAIAQLAKLEAAAKQGGPVRFFLWAHYLDPHADYADHDAPFGRGQRDLYDGEVRYVDEQVGRVLDRLAAGPFARRTVVIVTSDHGEAFGEHGMVRHGHELWEPLVRVPLVIHVPGLDARRVEARRSLIDLVPTVLDLAGLPAPPHASHAADGSSDFVSGVSLLADLLGGPGAGEARDFFVDMPAGPYNDARRALVHGDWKLVTSNGARFELYDLRSDPGETRDLYRTDVGADLERRYRLAKARLREIQVGPPKR